MTRHFCYEGDDCTECNGRWRSGKPKPSVDVSWVTLDQIPAPIAWPWWLAVPVAALRRLVR